MRLVSGFWAELLTQLTADWLTMCAYSSQGNRFSDETKQQKLSSLSLLHQHCDWKQETQKTNHRKFPYCRWLALPGIKGCFVFEFCFALRQWVPMDRWWWWWIIASTIDRTALKNGELLRCFARTQPNHMNRKEKPLCCQQVVLPANLANFPHNSLFSGKLHIHGKFRILTWFPVFSTLISSRFSRITLFCFPFAKKTV